MRSHASSIAPLSNYIARAGLVLVCFVALLLSACGSGEPKPAEPAAAPAAPAEQAATEAPDAAATPRTTANVWRGDLDGMTGRRLVRMLVVYSKTIYFLDKSQQRGITYDMGMELEKYLNAYQQGQDPADSRDIHSDRSATNCCYRRSPRDGATSPPAGLTITPERSRQVDFTGPSHDDVNEILVTAPEGAPPALGR